MNARTDPATWLEARAVAAEQRRNELLKDPYRAQARQQIADEIVRARRNGRPARRHAKRRWSR